MVSLFAINSLLNSSFCDLLSNSLSCLIFSLSLKYFLSFSSLAFLRFSSFAFSFARSFSSFSLSLLCFALSLSLSLSLLAQEQVQIVLKIFFLSRKLGKILDECITYFNEVFYPRLLLSSYHKWRGNKMFPHACFQFIKCVNAWFSPLLHSRLSLLPPLRCTSYKPRSNMPKNVRLTIFTKQWLHQLLCIPHPISK